MGSISKSFALFIILIIATSSLSLLIVRPASAQTPMPSPVSIPKPSIPEFTLKFVHTYYFETTTDPNTGVNRTQQYDNNTIAVTIKNQPYADSINGSNYHLFYDVRMKPHLEKKWTELYPLESHYNREFKSYLDDRSPYVSGITPLESDSEYTSVSLTYYHPPLNSERNSFPPFPLTSNTQVDFQVEAVVGHDSQAWIADHIQSPVLGGHYAPATAFDTSSSWSSTQTITMPDTSASASLNPTPTVPEFLSWTIPLLLSLMVLAAGLLVYHNKRKRGLVAV